MSERLSPLLLLLALSACADGNHEPFDEWNGDVAPPPNGVAAFSYLPVNVTGTYTSLGHLNPPGHVLPTNHVYLYAVDFTARPPIEDQEVRPVLAPATGTVAYKLQPVGTDWKIAFRATKDFYFILDHIVLTRTLNVGEVVQAGEQIGVTNPGGSIDLGAFDLSKQLPGFANPSRYGRETLYCVSPWAYFTEPLRSQNYAHIRRAPGASDKDGHIDLDVPGTLAGAWYDPSVALNETEGPLGWPRTVAFAVDEYDPSLVRISIGGTIAERGLWGIPDDAPRPVQVTPASGAVAYRLMYLESTTVQWGLMLVQLVDAAHLKIEVFPGSQSVSGVFTANARTWVR